MAEFTYRFEELPLVSEDGFDAGLISGEATIGYYADGEWFVRAISLDAYRRHQTGQLEIEDRTGWLYTTIYSVLDSGNWQTSIQERVNDALADEGLSRRNEHSTHYSVYSGV